jgi:hypothetical protein
MHKIENNDLSKLIPLCREDDFITLAVLQGTCKGWALVDSKGYPKYAAVFQAYGGIINCIGDVPDEGMAKEIENAVINYSSERDFVNWVEFANYPEEIVPLLEESIEKIDRIQRIYCEHDKDTFLNIPEPKIEENIIISPINKSDLENETILNNILLFWNNAEI